MSQTLKPITVLLSLETIAQLEAESKETGINKGVLARSIIMKHYNVKDKNYDKC